jgi:hypothetical protein
MHTAEVRALVKPPRWPSLDAAALHGICGQVVSTATRYNEADPAAVLITTLVGLGAMIGRGPFIRVGDTVHHTRLFAAIVGASSRARKGSSADPVKRLLLRAEQRIVISVALARGGRAQALIVSPGPLSTGEGVVWAIRDASDHAKGKYGRPSDPGVKDKRMLVLDGELGSALRAMQRSGNLSAVLRTLWDGGDVVPMTKTCRIRTTEPHVCVVGHITRQDLTRWLGESNIWNGVGGRFLWIAARRPRLVALPKPMPDNCVEMLAGQLATVVSAAQSAGEITLSADATSAWESEYARLSRDEPGAVGAVTSRAEAQVMRLAMLYALLDGSTMVRSAHLSAALALWRYSLSSARLIFGGIEEDPLIGRILEALSSGPKAQSELHASLSKHTKATALRNALNALQTDGRIISTTKPTGGKPVTIWNLNKPC